MSGELVTNAGAFVAAYNDRDWERMRGLLASDCVYVEITKPERRVEGGDEVVRVFQAWAQSVPDPKGAVTNAIAQDSAIAIEVELQGMAAGPFGDFSSAKKPAVLRGAFFFAFEGELIKEFRLYFDSLVLFQVFGIRT
jgi:steroid delta-isomerase-like uncharacterized protein